MRLLLKILCGLALALTILPPLLLWAGKMDANSMKNTMFFGLILWFCAAVPLNWKKSQE